MTPNNELTAEERLRRQLERAWIRGWIDRIRHDRKWSPLDREAEIKEIMEWDGQSEPPFLTQSLTELKSKADGNTDRH